MSSGFFNPEEQSILASRALYALQGNFFLAGPHDPSVVATCGPRGAIWIQTSPSSPIVSLFQKQDDGTTTNWLRVAFSGAPSGIDLESSGTPVLGSPFTTINFLNSNIVNTGGGTAQVEIGVDAPNVSYTPTTATDWPTVITNAQEALDSLATTVNLETDFEVYVDFYSGSDTTGKGIKLRPYKTIQKALTEIAANPATGNYCIILAAGTYTGAPIAWPVQANKNVSVIGSGVSTCVIDPAISYTSLGLSDEFIQFQNVSVTNQMVFDLSLGTSVQILLGDGKYSVKRLDTNPIGPTFIKIINSVADGFDLSSVCLMQNCQFLGGGTNIVNATGFLLMSSTVFSSMSAQIDGNIALIGTNAQGSNLSGTGIVTSDSSSLYNLTIAGPSVLFFDDAYKVGYSPANPLDWAIVPTNVGDALDQLAASMPSAPSDLIDGLYWVSENGSDITGDGSLSKPFRQIQAAINKAVADGHGFNSQAEVLVMPASTYYNGFSTRNGINVKGIHGDRYGVRVSGTVYLEADNSGRDTNSVEISNITIQASGAGVIAIALDGAYLYPGNFYFRNALIKSTGGSAFWNQAYLGLHTTTPSLFYFDNCELNGALSAAISSSGFVYIDNSKLNSIAQAAFSCANGVVRLIASDSKFISNGGSNDCVALGAFGSLNISSQIKNCYIEHPGGNSSMRFYEGLDHAVSDCVIKSSATYAITVDSGAAIKKRNISFENVAAINNAGTIATMNNSEEFVVEHHIVSVGEAAAQKFNLIVVPNEISTQTVGANVVAISMLAVGGVVQFYGTDYNLIGNKTVNWGPPLTLSGLPVVAGDEIVIAYTGTPNL